MTHVRQLTTVTRLKHSRVLGIFIASLVATATRLPGQDFFHLKDVRPGLHGVGRTVFEGNRIEEFQVEILGVLENIAPKQSIILAKLSGGPLAETGVLQGMSGSPVYIGGKLLGAVALGFPFSKTALAGIQPIEQMVADATFAPAASALSQLLPVRHLSASKAFASTGLPSNFNALEAEPLLLSANVVPSLGNMTQILTPLALNGFTSSTLQAFAPEFRRFGFEPQQGVSAGSPNSQDLSGVVAPGSMISVQLLSGDFSVSADGTVTYIDGKKIFAFGHRFLDGGPTELPFARADVITLLPTLNTSTKISTAREWVGTILSDRATAIAGEIGRRAHTIPLTISVRPPSAIGRDYHMNVVDDRLFTPFLTQTALFSAVDATQRTVGAGTLRLRGQVRFEGSVPPLSIQDIFVSDSGLPQQASADAVVTLGFVLGAGFNNLKIKDMNFSLEPMEGKQQVRITQVWTSTPEVHPGESVQVNAQLRGDSGVEFTRSATYRIPIGAPAGYLDFTVSDANGLNFPEFAGLTPSSIANPTQMIEALNKYRGSESAYLRVWRQEPSFAISGQLPGGDLSDPPPSAMLILADPSASASTTAPAATVRGSEIAEIPLPLAGYVVSGAKTVMVEVKE